MPELRSGARTGRAKLAPHNRRSQAPAGGNHVKTRSAVAREVKRPRTRLEAKRLKERVKETKKDKVLVISAREDSPSLGLGLESKKKRKSLGVCAAGVGQERQEKKAGEMADGSGGLSANKATGQEEEGSTAPFPEHVWFFFFLFVIVIFHLFIKFSSILVFSKVLLFSFLSFRF
uniref:Uncharacterized protein MANES_15G104900 n=1 Tax=Rhizophora mucronata TaxID=61149 RepID=A0A2P2MPZ2_RHIMU